jgi:hypothetical protein
MIQEVAKERLFVQILRKEEERSPTEYWKNIYSLGLAERFLKNQTGKRALMSFRFASFKVITLVVSIEGERS